MHTYSHSHAYKKYKLEARHLHFLLLIGIYHVSLSQAREPAVNVRKGDVSKAGPRLRPRASSVTPKYLEHVCFSPPTCHCPLCGCLSTVVITFSHIHTCMCVCLRACMPLHTHVEARGQPLMFAVVRNRISHWPGADQLCLAGWAASPRACLTLSSPEPAS